MSAPKWILIGTACLFSSIGIAAFVKKNQKARLQPPEQTVAVVAERKETAILSVPAPQPVKAQPIERPVLLGKDDFPNIDRIFQLFSLGPIKLPIVETIQYASSVSWMKGRPAWIADYANYYNTSRHFIARSLNGTPDYFSQKIREGSVFNVFRKDKKIHFHLLVDISRCKMGFYYVDLDTNERVLLKTYKVGLGHTDPSSSSGIATPLGRYRLGNRTAVYKPGVTGYYQDQVVEMIRIFGTRWIPLEKEEGEKFVPTGYGLQGAPWSPDSASGQLVQQVQTIGSYHSNGCICLDAEEINELFAIVVSKPTFVDIVKDFHEAKLPGVEVAAPSR